MFSVKNPIIPKESQTLSFSFEKQRASPKEELTFILIYVLLSSLLALSKITNRFFLETRGASNLSLCKTISLLAWHNGVMSDIYRAFAYVTGTILSHQESPYLIITTSLRGSVVGSIMLSSSPNRISTF